MWDRLSAEDKIRVLGIMFTSIGLGIILSVAVLIGARENAAISGSLLAAQGQH